MHGVFHSNRVLILINELAKYKIIKKLFVKSSNVRF